MFRFWSRGSQTVRPRSSGKVPLLPCLLIFCLTAITVYRWGDERRHNRPVNLGTTYSVPTYTARAYVLEKVVVPDAAAEPRITTTRTPITSTDADSRRAVEMANTLAERYVGNCHARWLAKTEEPRLRARQAADRAGRDYIENVARRDALERRLREASAQAAAQATAKANQTNKKNETAPTIEATQPLMPRPMIDNPRWIELQGQLAKTKRRREQLLADRTPIHPAVLEVDTKIASIQQELAAVPRQIPDPRPEAVEIPPTPKTPKTSAAIAGSPADDSVPRAAAERIAKEKQRELDDLTVAVEKARQARDKAELAEKQVETLRQSGPQLTIEHARVIQAPGKIENDRQPLMWYTLASGVLMTLGVGLMWLGMGMEPPVTNAVEMEAALGIHVVGMVPAHGPADERKTSLQHRTLVRHTAITLGLLLMIACPLVAFWGIGGM